MDLFMVKSEYYIESDIHSLSAVNVCAVGVNGIMIHEGKAQMELVEVIV
jgi:hypothetical protein